MSNTPFIIPVFIPQAGCPHQCVFCNQETITGISPENNWQLAQEQARQTVRDFLAFKRNVDRKVELAFFGGNFLGQSAGQIAWYLQFARDLYQTGQIDALRFSTRPDTITRQNLAMLQGLPVSVIELGAQSMHDNVLQKSGRGHSVRDTERAAELLREFNLDMGIQIMVGLPGDCLPLALETGHRVAALHPVCVRIYPTLVLKSSPLAQIYLNGCYKPLTLDQAVNVSAQLYRIFTRKNIKVIRMGLQASNDLQLGETILAGPYHPSFGHLVVSRLFLWTLQRAIAAQSEKEVAIVVHPGQISHVRGIKNANVQALQAQWPALKYKFTSETALAKTQLAVNGQIYDIIL